MSTMQDRKKVAVVHGRNSDAVEALWSFLEALKLDPREWERVIRDLGQGSPHNFDVVEELFRKIQAVVVLMTPDDEASLRPFLRTKSDPEYETRPMGQPRQNVLIEGGMAFALHKARTIIVEIGRVRPASDFQGMNVVRIGGSKAAVQASLAKLAGRLSAAECEIDQTGSRWLDTARFEAALRRLNREDRLPSNPLFRKTDRGITLAEAITDTGLIDIENREDHKDRHLPPINFYRRATREVAISGISAARTFDLYVANLRRMLAKDVRIKILIMHPDSADIPRLEEKEGDRPIRDDIRGVLKVIEAAALREHPNFDIRFMATAPPFTATMIDSDIDPMGSSPSDARGEIRVQPAVLYGSQHKGLIIQLKKKGARSNAPAGAFDYFADDLRRQWKDADRTFPQGPIASTS